MDTKRSKEINNDKIQRILAIYTRIMNGETVNKKEEAMR